MTALEDYRAKHGPTAGPWQEDWDLLNDWEKEQVKQRIPGYIDMSPEEQKIAVRIHKLIAGGDPVDQEELERLIGKTKMSGPLSKWWRRTSKELLESTGKDFAKEFGLKAKDFEAQIAKQFAARGLLSSSAMGSAFGGGMADLMLGRAEMQEESRKFDVGTGQWLAGFGKAWEQSDISNEFAFADYTNKLFLQNLGLLESELNYLGRERQQENIFNLQSSGLWQGAGGWDPYTTADVVSFGAQLLPELLPTPGDFMNMYAMSQGGGAGGGGGGGGF